MMSQRILVCAIVSLLTMVVGCGGASSSKTNDSAATPDRDGGSDGETESDGAAGRSSDADAGVPSLVDCAGVEIASSGNLDLDLRAIHVSGKVLLNGQLLPDENASRGRIVFRDLRQGAEAKVDLGSQGALSYALTLPKGTYDVLLEGNTALCDGNGLPQMPCGSGPVLTGIELLTKGALDIDIPVGRLSGSVTLKGDTFPDATFERGLLTFTAKNGASAFSKSFGASGHATYTMTLLPGTYDVSFVGNASLCTEAQPSPIPCNSGIIQRSVSVSSEGVLDLDVSAVKISGNVTLDGAELPDEELDRGAISFSHRDGSLTSGISSQPFGSAGPGTYTLTLLPGTYDIAFNGNPRLCGATTPSRVPCNSGTIIQAAQLTQDGAVDINLAAVSVSGTVTLDGAPLPSESDDRGALQFKRAGVAPVATEPFGSSGAVRYQLTLLAGSYDVLFVSNPELCGDGAPSRVPCVGGPVLASQSLTTNGVLDVDLHAIRVTGNITANGAPLPDEPDDRGQILFSLERGGTVVAALLEATGSGHYDVSLLPGTYAIQYIANEELCETLPLPSMPCVGGTLIPAVQLSTDGALDVDIPSRTISGNVTLNGEPLPSEKANRGMVMFARIESELRGTSNSVKAKDLLEEETATYGLTLLPGKYVVSHAANPKLCGPGLSPNVPCASQILLGCD